MMSIRSLADFNGSSLGGDSDWLTPPPSPPRPQTPGRHGERGIGTSNWPPAETFTWPHTGTFSWPRTNGISDTYPLGILAEAPGLGIPVVVLPFVNSALAGRTPFEDSVNALRNEGVRILLGPGEFEPHPPGCGGERISDSPGTSPWRQSLRTCLPDAGTGSDLRDPVA